MLGPLQQFQVQKSSSQRHFSQDRHPQSYQLGQGTPQQRQNHQLYSSQIIGMPQKISAHKLYSPHSQTQGVFNQFRKNYEFQKIPSQRSDSTKNIQNHITSLTPISSQQQIQEKILQTHQQQSLQNQNQNQQLKNNYFYLHKPENGKLKEFQNKSVNIFNKKQPLNNKVQQDQTIANTERDRYETVKPKVQWPTNKENFATEQTQRQNKNQQQNAIQDMIKAQLHKISSNQQQMQKYETAPLLKQKNREQKQNKSVQQSFDIIQQVITHAKQNTSIDSFKLNAKEKSEVQQGHNVNKSDAPLNQQQLKQQLKNQKTQSNPQQTLDPAKIQQQYQQNYLQAVQQQLSKLKNEYFVQNKYQKLEKQNVPLQAQQQTQQFQLQVQQQPYSQAIKLSQLQPQQQVQAQQVSGSPQKTEIQGQYVQVQQTFNQNKPVSSKPVQPQPSQAPMDQSQLSQNGCKQSIIYQQHQQISQIDLQSVLQYDSRSAQKTQESSFQTQQTPQQIPLLTQKSTQSTQQVQIYQPESSIQEIEQDQVVQQNTETKQINQEKSQVFQSGINSFRQQNILLERIDELEGKNIHECSLVSEQQKVILGLDSNQVSGKNSQSQIETLIMEKVSKVEKDNQQLQQEIQKLQKVIEAQKNELYRNNQDQSQARQTDLEDEIQSLFNITGLQFDFTQQTFIEAVQLVQNVILIQKSQISELTKQCSQDLNASNSSASKEGQQSQISKYKAFITNQSADLQIQKIKNQSLSKTLNLNAKQMATTRKLVENNQNEIDMLRSQCKEMSIQAGYVEDEFQQQNHNGSQQFKSAIKRIVDLGNKVSSKENKE